MERMQPYFRLNKKMKFLEMSPSSTKFIHRFPLTDEEVAVVEKLIQRDFKTAILYRLSENEGISTLANDIITQRG